MEDEVRRSIPPWIAVWMLLLLVAPALAEDGASKANEKAEEAEAKEAYGRGAEHFEAARYEEALAELATLDPRQAQALELRFFADLPVSEIAELLSVSKRTVEGDLLHGRAWLRRRLAAEGDA